MSKDVVDSEEDLEVERRELSSSMSAPVPED
jgi:hypothetical protein